MLHLIMDLKVLMDTKGLFTKIGYQWDDANPKIQLEPIGKRGYIELMPIKA